MLFSRVSRALPWYFPVDGVEGMSRPVVPFHELLAKSWAASCFSESMGESSCDSFIIDSEAGFGAGMKGTIASVLACMFI